MVYKFFLPFHRVCFQVCCSSTCLLCFCCLCFWCFIQGIIIKKNVNLSFQINHSFSLLCVYYIRKNKMRWDGGCSSSRRFQWRFSCGTNNCRREKNGTLNTFAPSEIPKNNDISKKHPRRTRSVWRGCFLLFEFRKPGGEEWRGGVCLHLSPPGGAASGYTVE